MEYPYTPEEQNRLHAAALSVLPSIYDAFLGDDGDPSDLTLVDLDAISFHAYSMAESLILCGRRIANAGVPQTPPPSPVIAAVQTGIAARTPSSVPNMPGTPPQGPGAPLTINSPLKALLAVLPDFHYLQRLAADLVSKHHKVDAVGVTPASLDTVTIGNFLEMSKDEVCRVGTPSYGVIQAVAHTLRTHRIAIPPDSVWAIARE